MPLLRPLLKPLLRTLLGAVLVVALLRLGRPADLAAALRHAGLSWLAAAFLPFAALFLLEALRLRVAFAEDGLDLGTALRLTLIGAFFGNFTPGMLGGEVYKLRFLHRQVRHQKPGLAGPVALLLALRLTGLAALLLLAAAALLAEPESAARLGAVRWRGPAAATLGIGALLAAAALALAWATRRGRAALRRSGASARLGLLEGAGALRRLGARRLAAVSVLSLLAAAARALSLHLLARALDAGVSFAEAAPVAALSMLAGSLPVSVGGLGVQEGAVAAGLALFGAPRAAAVAVALLGRLFLWTVAAAGWAVWLSARRRGAAPGEERSSAEPPARPPRSG